MQCLPRSLSPCLVTRCHQQIKYKPVHMSYIHTRVLSVNIKAHMLKDIFLASRISLLFNLAFFVISQFWHLTLGLLDVARTWQDWQVKWVVLGANKETFIYCTLQLSVSYILTARTWSSLCLMAWYQTEHYWLSLCLEEAWCNINVLMHWGQDKMADILQTTFSIAFSSMKMLDLWFNLHWNLLPGVQLTISQHWCRYHLTQNITIN